jgi:hypothetical protein
MSIRFCTEQARSYIKQRIRATQSRPFSSAYRLIPEATVLLAHIMATGAHAMIIGTKEHSFVSFKRLDYENVSPLTKLKT